MDKQTHPLDERKHVGSSVRHGAMRKLAKDGKSWTPTEQLARNRMMKQFCKMGRKGVEVGSGNSEAYQEGWERIFGGKG